MKLFHVGVVNWLQAKYKVVARMSSNGPESGNRSGSTTIGSQDRAWPVVPARISAAGVQRVLQGLLNERVSIRDLPAIVEAIAEAASHANGVAAIVEVLRRHARPLSSLHVQRCTRLLRERADEAMRYELLDVLLTVAAADGTITHEEIVSMRNLTSALQCLLSASGLAR